MIDINSLGSGKMFAWSKEYLVKVVSTGVNPIVTDPIIINALLKIDRKDFIPETLQPKSYMDIELDIGYGEKINKPTIIAQMISLLKPRVGGKYLDLGTGAGYVAVVLGFIAGSTGSVFTMERVQWLWEQARSNSAKYPEVRNVNFLYRDGAQGLVSKAPFDGIHVSFAMEAVPEELKRQLKVDGGRLVCPTTDMNLRVIERKGIEEFEEEIIPGFIFDPVKLGVV